MNEKDKYKENSRYIRIYDNCGKIVENEIAEFKITDKVIAELDYFAPKYCFYSICGRRYNKSDILRKNFGDKLEMEYNPMDNLYTIRKIRRGR